MMRMYCLNCGRYWKIEGRLEAIKNCCPFCGDLYFGDNVIDDKPPDLYEPETVECEHCKQSFVTDTVGDVTRCTWCKKDLKLPPSFKRLSNWQDIAIDGLVYP